MSDVVPEIDISRPHSARMYDYYLGGKDNFAPDREAAEKVLAGMPTGRTFARENRAFMGRAVRFLTGEAGIRQFLDIGAGLPAANNVHEVAQAVAPESRIVYADHDPLVLAHARALLTSSAEGRTAYIHADLREPEAILANPATKDVLDFGQPIALMLVAVLHFIMDDEKPAEIIKTLVDALPSGSYLVASHLTGEHDRASMEAAGRHIARPGSGVRPATPTTSHGWRSRGLNSWRRESLWCRNGGRPTPGRGRLPRRSTATAESRASVSAAVPVSAARGPAGTGHDPGMLH
jgi:hypothetical protein